MGEQEVDRAAKVRAKAKPKPKPAPATVPAPPTDQERRARRLDAEIEQAEAELAAIDQELADPSSWGDPRSAAKSQRRHAAAKARVDALYAELEAVAGWVRLLTAARVGATPSAAR